MKVSQGAVWYRCTDDSCGRRQVENRLSGARAGRVRCRHCGAVAQPCGQAARAVKQFAKIKHREHRCDVCAARLPSFTERTRCLRCTDRVQTLRDSLRVRLNTAAYSRGFTQKQLAEALGLSVETVRLYLCGGTVPRGARWERVEEFIAASGGERVPSTAIKES